MQRRRNLGRVKQPGAAGDQSEEEAAADPKKRPRPKPRPKAGAEAS